MPKPTVIAFIQARLTSTRLPKKVLAKIGPWTVLELMLKRLSNCETIAKTIIVTPDNPENDELAKYVSGTLQYPLVRGDENDVLSRFIKASKVFPAAYYVRMTADCPLICPEIVDDVIRGTIKTGAAYGSNASPPTFPDGFDVECFSSDALTWLNANITDIKLREHVTLGLRENAKSLPQFKFFNLAKRGASADWIRLTLDNPDDLAVFHKIAAKLNERVLTADAEQLIQVYEKNDLHRINGRHTRNEKLAQMGITPHS